MRSATANVFKNPPIWTPGTKPSAIFIISILTNRLNRPNVRILIGNAIIRKTGFNTRLIIRRAKPSSSSAEVLLIKIPPSILNTISIERIKEQYFKDNLVIFLYPIALFHRQPEIKTVRIRADQIIYGPLSVIVPRN
jgi:hypothetical protein